MQYSALFWGIFSQIDILMQFGCTIFHKTRFEVRSVMVKRKSVSLMFAVSGQLALKTVKIMVFEKKLPSGNW